SKSDGFVYAIGRDVTLEKLAEQEAEIKRKQIEIAEQYALEASHAKSFFMIKLSHQLRNSLTGIIGYLQLLSNKFYETEEEMMSYLQYAEQSSEEIFTFVSDIVDAALDQGESSLDSFVTTKIEPALVNALDVYKKQDRKENISLNIDTSGATPTAVVSPSLLEKSLVLIYDALATDMDNVSFDVVVQENTYDGAVELQILGPGNSEVADLIKIYRENQNNIINVISRDKQDVMLNLAKASSIIRRMNGAMSVETFGGEEGNLVMLTLPMVKRT
ncbi:MAG TPA: histidine kinase dimerization/phospho-acceptor domain-containing protein, partial [Candidatus Kapabacteria bacterium]|nr:histidine kinase dimerization/phospho-acceptor domain-containing protein [Candidatus Kapabacteria bacterium]